MSPTETRLRVRPIAGWATATMAAIAACTVAYLWLTFEPLLDAWAARRTVAWVGGVDLAAVASFGGTAALATMLFLVWLTKARANVRVFRGGRFTMRDRVAAAVWLVPVTNLVLPLLQTTDLAVASAGRDPRARRRMTTLVGLWWGAILATLLAYAGAAYEGHRYAAELRDLHDRTAHGRAVDVPLATDLFGGEVARALPSAVLLLLAAVLALVMVARVTGAQYARVARLRGARRASGRTALRSTADDWTVVLPTAALAGLAAADAEVTAVLPLPALGGTISA
jgi:hypothetical protein